MHFAHLLAMQALRPAVLASPLRRNEVLLEVLQGYRPPYREPVWDATAEEEEPVLVAGTSSAGASHTGSRYGGRDLSKDLERAIPAERRDKGRVVLEMMSAVLSPAFTSHAGPGCSSSCEDVFARLSFSDLRGCAARRRGDELLPRESVLPPSPAMPRAAEWVPVGRRCPRWERTR